MARHTKYAKVVWTPDDIQTLRPEWTIARCEEFLSDSEGSIQDRTVELGWEVIECLLPPKEVHDDERSPEEP